MKDTIVDVPALTHLYNDAAELGGSLAMIMFVERQMMRLSRTTSRLSVEMNNKLQNAFLIMHIFTDFLCLIFSSF